MSPSWRLRIDLVTVQTKLIREAVVSRLSTHYGVSARRHHENPAFNAGFSWYGITAVPLEVVPEGMKGLFTTRD